MSISRMSRGGARRPSCFIRDTNGQALAYAYFEDEPGRRAAAKTPHPRRGAAHRRQHRQAAGAAAQATDLYRPTSAITSTSDISLHCAH